MNIKDKINKIYNEELRELIGELKSMTKDERMELYTLHTKRLFKRSKRIITIEELLNDNVKVNREKFRHCFMIICEDFFSTTHFGEYNKRRFMNKTGLNTQRFFQKVIMSLSLMGYIKEDGIKCNCSSGNHGYIYYVNYLKWKGLELDLWKEELKSSEDPFENLEWVGVDNGEIIPDKEDDDVEKEWLVKKQLHTINSMSVNKKVYQSMMVRKDEILSDPEIKSWCSKELTHINNLENLYHRKKSRMKTSIDGDGRLYTVMTHLKSSWRKDGTLNIKGEGFCEVDMSSLHPTLFGLMVIERYPDVKSQWVKHCLKGDFYEWVMDITGMCEYSCDRITKEMEKIIGVYFYKDRDNRKSMKDKVVKYEEIINKVKSIESDDPHIRLRPVVKQWMMEFLFSKFSMKSTEKDGETVYKHFCHNLCRYLKEQEPYIYDMLMWFRNKENQVPKKDRPTKTKSQLPSYLKKKEVEFIKKCLESLDPVLEYVYTVHDCIGCLVSDVDLVKYTMETVSQKLYGVKLNLKIEGETYENQLWKMVV